MTTKFDGKPITEAERAALLRVLNRRLAAWCTAFGVFAAIFAVAFFANANVLLLQVVSVACAVGGIWTIGQREKVLFAPAAETASEAS